MEFILKPLTEVSSYIFLSGIFMIILGALIGITPPDSRKTLHTSLAIPLFIAVGLVYIFRSFDFLVYTAQLIFAIFPLHKSKKGRATHMTI